jgi:hypothetical protein
VKTFVDTLLGRKEGHSLKLLGLNSAAMDSEQTTVTQLERLKEVGIISLASPEGSATWWRRL